ncbi:hypothetical protein EON83_26250 [bacterium]|nr:MAG: hypothetical protein EON83_26250 [bacterium]
MEDISESPPPIPNNWKWDATNHRVGPFRLRGSIEEVAHLVEKLERYPDEKYDTYLIQGTRGCKLFVKANGISSIQCGERFIVNGTDIMGLGANALACYFDSPFFISQQSQEYTDYMNKARTFKIIVDNAQEAIIWIIYADPTQW